MLNLHWALYIVIANIAIAFVEYTYRAGQYQTFAAALPYIVVPILVSQWALFYGFSKADSILLAGAVFSLINIIFRLCVTHYLGETLNVVNWIGVALLAISVILLKVK